MNIKVTKGNLAFISLVLLWSLAMVLFIFDTGGKGVFLVIAPTLIDAMKWISLAFLGAQVVDNGVKGKFFNAGLAEK